MIQMEQLRLIVDAVPALVAYLDTGYILRFTNENYARWFGLRPEEIVGRHLREIIGETAWEDLRPFIDRSLAGEQLSYEREVYYAHSRPRWISAGYVPDRDQDGRVRGIVALITDISAAKRVEEELVRERQALADRVAERTAELAATNQLLARSEERWKFAVEGSGLGLWDLHVPTGEVYYSPRWKEMLGYQDKEIALNLEQFYRLVHPDDLPRLQEAVLEHYAGASEHYYCEFRMLAKDGSWRWIASRGKVISRDESGAPVRMLGTHADINEQRQVHEALVQKSRELVMANEKLLRATEAKSRFLANMSHELRTPLSTIVGYAEILLDRLRGPLTPQQEYSVSVMAESANHILTLVSDILDLSKIEADRMDLFPSEVAVEDICRAGLQFVREMAHRRNIALQETYIQNPGLMVTDVRRLKQILINLLSNALKFSPPGGKVGLDVDRSEPGLVRFTVWDTGIGLSEEDVKLLFQPYVQVNTGSNRHPAGTGLGLALVARLTELLGGVVTVESQPGVGSRFSVTLPTRDLEAAPAPPPPSGPETEELVPDGALPATPCLLMVDDNATFRDMVGGYLRRKGFTVREIAQGGKAVETMQRRRTDLVVLDIQMPDLDGFSVLRQIRALPGPAGAVPVVALTALAMPGDQERCLAAGADEYLAKPVSLKELEATIKRLLSAAGRAAQRTAEGTG